MIDTFLGAETCEPEGLPPDADVGVVGVPFDGAVSRRPGTRYGPRALREASGWPEQFAAAPGGAHSVDANRHVDDSELYGRHWHGSPMARIDELDRGSYETHAMVGIRAYERAGFPGMADEEGIHVNYARDVREKGIDACIEEAVAHATDGTEAVYLTVDIDAVDPSFAPGTGTPEPGGLTSAELLAAMDRLGRAPEIGAMAIARFLERRFL